MTCCRHHRYSVPFFLRDKRMLSYCNYKIKHTQEAHKEQSHSDTDGTQTRASQQTDGHSWPWENSGRHLECFLQRAKIAHPESSAVTLLMTQAGGDNDPKLQTSNKKILPQHCDPSNPNQLNKNKQAFRGRHNHSQLSSSSWKTLLT